MSADRHLLFGLLALQNEFIDKRQLVAAFGAWIADHARPLDEVLVLQSAIKEDDRALLSRLVDRHIAARGGDVSASLRSFNGSDPIREELERLADGDVLQSIAKLQPPPQNTIVHSIGQATSSGNRFEFRRPLDRGGLGIDERHHHKPIQHRNARERNKPHRSGDGKRHSAKPQREDAARQCQRNSCKYNQRILHFTEHPKEKQEDQEEADRNHNHQPLACCHEVLKLSAPFKPVAGRQFDLLADASLCFSDE